MEYIFENKNKLKDLQEPSGQGVIIKDHLGIHRKLYLDDDNFLANRFHRKIKSEMEWFEKIITHSPTVGSFYENLLRKTLREFAPSSNQIGTGFVFDTTRKKHGKQIDVLVYDDSDRSVIYRCDEFVVINPSSVISAIEVKKTLNSTTLKDVIRSTFFNNLGQDKVKYSCVQNIKIFSYKLQCKKETICNALVTVLEECIESLKVSVEGQTGHLPITYCALPQLYFLDEQFYIETKLKTNNENLFFIEAHVHDTQSNGSIGALLESSISENRDKVFEHEKSYLQNVLTLPPKVLRIEGTLSLIDNLSYHDFVEHFSNYKSALAALEYNGHKPVSLTLSKGVDLFEYSNPNEFFSSCFATFEMYMYSEDKISSIHVAVNEFKI